MIISKALYAKIETAASIAEPIFRANGWKLRSEFPTSKDLYWLLVDLVSRIVSEKISRIDSGRFIVFKRGLKIQISLELEK